MFESGAAFVGTGIGVAMGVEVGLPVIPLGGSAPVMEAGGPM